MTGEYERRTAEILRHRLGGSVTQRDVPGAPPQTHDLDVKLSDGSLIAVEVTSLTHPEAQAFWRAVASDCWSAPTLSKSWVLDVDPKARIKTLRGEVVNLLREKEQAGENEFGRGSGSGGLGAGEGLGVRSGRAYDWSPPYIYVTSVGDLEWADVEDLRRGVEGVAWASDNRKKLARANAQERHLVVWVDLLNTKIVAALEAMKIGKLPSGCCLPPEIDVIWVAQPTQADKGRIVCEELWRYDRGGGWMKVQ